MVFVGYIWYEEYSIATGTIVRLQTRPVDPNDFFRGDYVTLSYDITNVCDLPPLKKTDENWFIYDTPQYYTGEYSAWESYVWGKLVYVSLVESWDIMAAQWCYDKKPDWLFIKWLSQRRWWVEYGIEKYFVQQGHGKELEQARGKMKIQVSISKSGKARIVDYRLE